VGRWVFLLKNCVELFRQREDVSLRYQGNEKASITGLMELREFYS
jgi:hypothetical protein